MKRYTSAILIICMLWAFIGYEFSARYLKADWYQSLAGSALMMFMVVQIERQVILSNTVNKIPLYFRGMIAILMGIIGSIIIDQIIFQEDIQQEKVFMMADKVNKVFPARAAEMRRQMNEIDSTILAKEGDRKLLEEDISKNRTINFYSTKTEDKIVGDSIIKFRTTEVESRPNPKINLLSALDIQIANRRVEKAKKDSMMLALRPRVEAELAANVGFLDELELMISILTDSPAALITWIIWFLILFCIEIFIVVSKLKETEVDYDFLIQQQMELHLRRIELLKEQSILKT